MCLPGPHVPLWGPESGAANISEGCEDAGKEFARELGEMRSATALGE